MFITNISYSNNMTLVAVINLAEQTIMAGRSAKIATKVFIRNMIDEMLPVQRKPSSLTTWPICKVIAVRILLRAWGVDSKEFPHLSKQDYRIPLLLTDYSLCHVNRRHGAVFVIQIHRFFSIWNIFRFHQVDVAQPIVRGENIFIVRH